MADGGVAALAGGPRNAAGPRSIVARRSVILRTVRGEISCRDNDNHWAGSWCVTSYMECSARKYSRTSIISNSDISPYDTENFSDAYIIRTWELFQPPKIETIQLLLLP